MSAVLSERSVRLEDGGSARILWLAPGSAEDLRAAVGDAVAEADLRVLSGESRAQVRVREGYALVRATEISLDQRAPARHVQLAILSLKDALYIVAPAEAATAERLFDRSQHDARDPFDLFFLLWDDLVERLHEESEAVVAAAEEVAERVLIGPRRGLSHTTYRVRRRTYQLRLAVARANAAFAVLATERPDHWGGGASARLQELRERITAILEDVESVREGLAETVEAFSSVQANDMNQVMQVLTIVSLLFLPPTLIASIYGMNFRIPEYLWPHGYAFSLALMVVLTAALVLWAKARRLIR